MMKFLKLTAINVVTAIALLGAFGMAQTANAAETNAGQPAPAADKPDAGATAKAPAKNTDLSVDGTRGQIPDQIDDQGNGGPFCDVAPPCPEGCVEDASKNTCADKPGP